MKDLLFIPILVLIIVSCNNVKENNNTINEVEIPVDLKDSLQLKEQSVLISTSNDTTINLEGGVKISIPKNIFVDSNGELVDSVEIHFTESLTIESMILENLTTTSDSQLLISNGMLKFEAFSNGNELKIKEGEELLVYFPRNGETEDYDLFYGSRTTEESEINWEIATKKETKSTRKKINPKYIYNIRCSGYPIKINDIFTPTYKFEDKSIKENFFDYFIKNFNPSKKAMEWLIANHNLDGSSDSCGLYVEIKYNNDLSIKNIDLSNYDSRFMSEIETFLKSMPKINYGTVDYLDLDNKSIKFNIFTHDEIDKDDYTRQVEQNLINNNSPIQFNADYYVYSVTNLGWINCDRFYKYEETNDFYVNNAKDNIQYNLIFKNFKSILRSKNDNGKTFFSKIPYNEPVELIGFEIIRDSVIFGKEEFITSSNLVEINELKKISFKDFKNELKELSN